MDRAIRTTVIMITSPMTMSPTIPSTVAATPCCRAVVVERSAVGLDVPCWS